VSAPPLHQLRSAAELDRAVAGSTDRPLVIFKYSRTCGTSAAALDELLEHLEHARLDVHYAMVTVQTERELSDLIAQRLGVRHETPQALLIVDGRVAWSASHFRVNADALQAALSQVPLRPPRPTTMPTGS
jgi:thioredoxin 1